MTRQSLGVCLPFLLLHMCACSPSSLPSGSESAGCVTVSAGAAEVKAGNFTIGALASFRTSAGGGKIWWRPDSGDISPGLRITATPIDRSLEEKPRTFKAVGAVSGASTFFYPSSVKLPRPGTWRIEGTSGRDSGCIVISLL